MDLPALETVPIDALRLWISAGKAACCCDCLEAFVGDAATDMLLWRDCACSARVGDDGLEGAIDGRRA